MVRYYDYRLESGELLGGRPRADHGPQRIFVAYRFDEPLSREFRERLALELARTESLRDAVISDGHSLPGKPWLSKIRELISGCDALLADITYERPEVLYEVGFGWGLGKVIIPVVESRDRLHDLPRWLTEKQVGNYESDSGWAEIVDAVGETIVARTQARPASYRDPIPHRAVWLPGPPEFEELKPHFEHSVRRFALSTPEGEIAPSELRDAPDRTIGEIERTSLLVACLANLPEDSLTHFAVGLVASRPMAGLAKAKVSRRVILTVPPSFAIQEVVSDSARRTGTVVRILRPNEVSSELVRHGQRLESWRKRNQGER